MVSHRDQREDPTRVGKRIFHGTCSGSKFLTKVTTPRFWIRFGVIEESSKEAIGVEILLPIPPFRMEGRIRIPIPMSWKP